MSQDDITCVIISNAKDVLFKDSFQKQKFLLSLVFQQPLFDKI